MLNLLPLKQKKELRLNLLNQAIICTVIAVIFIILILILLFLVARIFLNINLNETERELNFWQSRPEIKELESLEKKINELNKTLVFLDGAYKKQTKFSYFLENLAEDTPQDISFNNISIEESTRKVNIEGHATTREMLLTFKYALENAPYVSEFNFPLSNLTQTTNINFYLSFKFKENGL